MKTIIIFLITMFTFPITTYATKLYRHIPFELSMSDNDVLVVDYDFSGKNGVHCSANKNEVQINYTYKGYKKMNSLPVLLQNAHVPDKKTEKLADMSGQFSLSALSGQENGQYIVRCQYSDGA